VKKHLSFPEIAWERTAGVAPPRACDRREAAPRTQRVTRQSLGTRLRQRLRKGFMLWLALSTLAGCGQSSGDRVLVDKNLYETGLARPARFDVVVFKYPRGPVENGTPKNYIKRLLGLPGQILAIFFGQLYFWEPGPGEPPPYDDINNPKVKRQDLWQESFMHIDDEKSQGLFNTAGKFQIIRKPPAVIMALRRLVYDNDYPAADLKGKLPPRWNPRAGSSWTPQSEHREFSHPGTKGKDIDWLRYQHILRPDEWPVLPPQGVKPSLITDFMGYNSFQLKQQGDRTPSPNWCGDLMLECRLTVVKAEGLFFMELSKGINRFRARWDLATGKCTLLKQGPEGKKADRWTELASQDTSIKTPGSYEVRLANFDAQLTVWVNGKLPFGQGVAYDPPEIRAKGETQAKLSEEDLQARRGPRPENDLEPASIGSEGAAIEVRNVRIWRDTYYTLSAERSSDADLNFGIEKFSWSEPDTWGPLRRVRSKTMYVQPGHYLCLGDNSPASSDSRYWGTVPERLMLGRALLVYFPLSRAGPIR